MLDEAIIEIDPVDNTGRGFDLSHWVKRYACQHMSVDTLVRTLRENGECVVRDRFGRAVILRRDVKDGRPDRLYQRRWCK